MVDFLKHMSPEARAAHERHRARLAETIAFSDADLLGTAIHWMHNAGDPRDSEGRRLLAGAASYAAGLHHILLPELLRRLAGGRLSQKCPVCGAWQDWDRAFVEAPPPAKPYIDDAADPAAAMAEVLDGTCTDPACPIKGWHESHGAGR